MNQLSIVAMSTLLIAQRLIDDEREQIPTYRHAHEGLLALGGTRIFRHREGKSVK